MYFSHVGTSAKDVARRLRFPTVDRTRHGRVISLFRPNDPDDSWKCRDDNFGSGLCDVTQEFEITVRKLLQIGQPFFCLCIRDKPSDRRTEDRVIAAIRTEFF